VLAFSHTCIFVLYIYRDWVAITVLFIQDLRCYGWEGSMVDFISDLPILSFSCIHDVLLFLILSLLSLPAWSDQTNSSCVGEPLLAQFACRREFSGTR
jgi:hypothetical protein